MQSGNILRSVVTKSFGKGCQMRSSSKGFAVEKRERKRHAHRVERKITKMDLKNGREIRCTRLITGHDVV
jgi:hypothetical protein